MDGFPNESFFLFRNIYINNNVRVRNMNIEEMNKIYESLHPSIFNISVAFYGGFLVIFTFIFWSKDLAWFIPDICVHKYKREYFKKKKMSNFFFYLINFNVVETAFFLFIFYLKLFFISLEDKLYMVKPLSSLSLDFTGLHFQGLPQNYSKRKL